LVVVADGGRRFVQVEDVAGWVSEVFGAGRRPVGVRRLRGGSKKGVYRLGFDDGFSVILYSWADDEDFWPASPGAGEADPFGHASGFELFEASRVRLDAIGVRVPELYSVDRSQARYPADLALVEDVRGGTLEARLQTDPRSAEDVLDSLAAGLRMMSEHRARRFGKVAVVSDGGVPEVRSCVEVVLERALRDLAEAAFRVGRIGEARGAFESALREMADGVRPRTEYGLVHGELGPDHVLVDDRGEPVLIDIEGAMYFDVEWEHVFLEIRFREHYGRLRVDGLDERRMELYRLAQHLSLVAGPLRLLDGDFPERKFMMAIAEQHTADALRFLRSRAAAGNVHGRLS
jgi:hypothetical protein